MTVKTPRTRRDLRRVGDRDAPTRLCRHLFGYVCSAAELAERIELERQREALDRVPVLARSAKDTRPRPWGDR